MKRKIIDSKINNVMRKRSVFGMLLIFIMFTVCVIRLFLLSSDIQLQQTAVGQSTVKLNLYNLRADIYDCNLEKLTNEDYEEKTVFFPTADGIATAKKTLGEHSDEYKRLLSGFAVLTDKKIKNKDGILTVKIPKRYSEKQTATHILGYLDDENKGITGIEQGMDSYLYSEDYAYISYVTDAKKNLLSGVNYTLHNNSHQKGVVLTIDKNFQKTMENSLKKADCGAGVIVEVETGKIKAMASVPTYNPNNLQKSLKNKNAPFINRALSAYSTGSVFKTCVASAGVENNKSNKTYYCGGYVTINKQRFNCHKLEGHSFVDLQKALQESCNCYFYQYSNYIGAEEIYKIARNCGFGVSRNIGGGLIAKSGHLPELETIKNSPNALANFAIGQGDFTLSPLSMTNLYAAVCNEGSFISPYIIEGTIENGKFLRYDNNTAKTTVMSSQTAKRIKNMLNNCLESGTGASAKPEKAIAGGKTATAQTGWIKNGREVDNSWFCGFFEKDNKTYVVAILIEDIKTQNISCNAVFKEIVDKIYFLY